MTDADDELACLRAENRLLRMRIAEAVEEHQPAGARNTCPTCRVFDPCPTKEILTGKQEGQ